MYEHIQDRLETRDINLSILQINSLCDNCNVDTAIVIRKEYYLNDKCFLILIVRDHKPITVMYRRCSQKTTPQSLNVDKIINLIN
jgi:hypothetical protein